MKKRKLKGSRSAYDPIRGRICDHPLHAVYRNMVRRCLDDSFRQWNDYGGRGITLSSRWIFSFWNFVDDMGERPLNHTLERINNNKGYSKSNCKWASRTENNNNKRTYKNANPKTPFISKTRVKGVTRTKEGRFIARITVNGKRKYLGYFETIEQAQEQIACREALLKYNKK